MAAVPNTIGAGVILPVAYQVARFMVHILSTLLGGMNINALPEKLGIGSMFSESFTITSLVGGAIMFFTMLAVSTAAVNVLGIEIISLIFARVIEFGGSILVGSIILVIGYFLGNIACQKLSGSSGAGIANIARFAILGLVLVVSP